MAEIEASLLAKVRSAASSYDRPVLIGFLRGRKKRVGTLIEAASNQSLKELKREIKKKGGKKLKVYKEISTIYAEMPVDKVQELASVSCAQKVYDAEGDVKLSLDESVPLVMGVEKWQLPYRVKGHKLEGQGVKVAVIDSGIDKSHPDFGWFGWRVKASKNFSGGRASRGREHGTHVAGIIAGSGKASGYRYVGVAPKATIYDAKVFMNSDTPTTRDTIIDATLWAVKKGVDVINMSFADNHSCTDGTCPLCKTADYAASKGITVVAAAGNNGPAEGTIGCPGNAKDVITVGATTKTEPVVVAGFSSRGSSSQPNKPEIVAPGDNIMAPQPGRTYGSMTGTSMAAPHVSGMAALFHQSKSYVKASKLNNPTQIKESLQRSSVDLGEHKTAQGSGLINFKNHLVSLQKVKKRKLSDEIEWPPRGEYIFREDNFDIFRDRFRKELKFDNDITEKIIGKLKKDFWDNENNRRFSAENDLEKAIHDSLKQSDDIWIPIENRFDELFDTIIEHIGSTNKKGFLSFAKTQVQVKIDSSKKLSCPAAMKMFCPHYDGEHCNHIYETCIHYRMAHQTKMLKKIRENIR